MSQHYVCLEMDAAALGGSSVVTVMAGYDRMTGSWMLEVNDAALAGLAEDGFGGNVYDSCVDARLFAAGRGNTERPFAGLGFEELRSRLTDLCPTVPEEMLEAVRLDGVNQVAPYVKRWTV